MTNTGGTGGHNGLAGFTVVPDFEAALCAGWMGSRTQTVYLAALGLSREHSHCTGGEK